MKPRIIASKKRISLSPVQKRIAIGIAILLLVVGIYAGYAVWQNTVTDAATCASRTFKTVKK